MRNLLSSPVSTVVHAVIPTPPGTWHHRDTLPSSLFLSGKAITQPRKLVTSVFVSIRAIAESASNPACFESISGSDSRHWMVLVEDPPADLLTKSQIIDYYVSRLKGILGSEQNAQRCMYHASCDTHFGFCCEIDEDAAIKLASVAGVLSVKPDPDFESEQKDYSSLSLSGNIETSFIDGGSFLFPKGSTKTWMVRMERPAIGAIRKAQVVDYYVQVLMRVLRNEKDAQMCMYHVSWESNFGFCCELDLESAEQLTAMPGVLSVKLDDNFWSHTKDYGVANGSSQGVSGSSLPEIRTKKLFVTGLSFYTSEKTLRTAFEGYGEITEVKIIMDKISKRSKGYGFVEYTTEEAAMTALSEMNGKIINGWMITVDVAKTNAPKYTRSQPTTTRSSLS